MKKTIITILIALMLFALISIGIWFFLTRDKNNPDNDEIRLIDLNELRKNNLSSSSSTTLESYYETEKTELYSSLSITLIPTKIGNESINGIEIMLQNQLPPLPEPYQIIINANITGELQREWTCETLQKAIVRCSGSDPLALNEATILALYFNKPPILPEKIKMRLLRDSNFISSVEAAKRE